MTPTIHEWVYRVGDNTESTLHTGSTDPDEIRGLIANTYRVDETQIQIRRVT